MSQALSKSIDYHRQIKVVGFDLDQTLYPKSNEIDKAIQTYLYDKISSYLAIPVEEASRRFRHLYHEKGFSGSQSLIKLGLPDAKNAVQEALEKANIAEFLLPDPVTIALLKKIKRHYSNMDIITGSNSSNTYKKLKHMTINPELFGHIITGTDGAKSDGTTYRLWLESYPQYSPDQFLYIGDRAASDYLVPLGLGINSILVYVGRHDLDIGCPQLKSLKNIEEILF